MAQGCCACHLIHAFDERFSSTLSPPFSSSSSSSHSSFISCTSSPHFFHFLEGRSEPVHSAEKGYDETYSFTGYEPNAYDLKETYVESYTESLTHPQFSKQGFPEDVEYDDPALQDMLREAHRVHSHHSQREGLSVGQSSSVSERTGRPVESIGQELNVANAQIRTLLDRQKERILAECRSEIKKHDFQADYDRRSVRKLGEIIESQQEELHCAQAEELQRRDQQLLHERLLQQNWELREAQGSKSLPTVRRRFESTNSRRIMTEEVYKI